jgi:hypothetical protein
MTIVVMIHQFPPKNMFPECNCKFALKTTTIPTTLKNIGEEE